MTRSREYTEDILDVYLVLYNEVWPNGVSDDERQDLEALGRKEGQINQRTREEYYKSQIEKEIL